MHANSLTGAHKRQKGSDETKFTSPNFNISQVVTAYTATSQSLAQSVQ